MRKRTLLTAAGRHRSSSHSCSRVSRTRRAWGSRECRQTRPRLHPSALGLGHQCCTGDWGGLGCGTGVRPPAGCSSSEEITFHFQPFPPCREWGEVPLLSHSCPTPGSAEQDPGVTDPLRVDPGVQPCPRHPWATAHSTDPPALPSPAPFPSPDTLQPLGVFLAGRGPRTGPSPGGAPSSPCHTVPHPVQHIQLIMVGSFQLIPALCSHTAAPLWGSHKKQFLTLIYFPLSFLLFLCLSLNV